ncbi:helix-turn-helix transcriptional regulator [Candidatus Dependentiae bacterium]|nr:helix-turn-helix transcriptional regulator [Candidatus Dependentiae bacterium]
MGEKIKNYRVLREMSIEEVSEITGFSKELIAEIEENKTIPILSCLIKIARALGTRLGTFLDDNNECACVLTRNQQAVESARYISSHKINVGSLVFNSLAQNKKDRNMEPFLVTLQKDSINEKDNMSSHEGEEFIYVLKGKIGIKYGKEYYELSKGDSIYYDSAVMHNVHSLDNEQADILAVIYMP